MAVRSDEVEPTTVGSMLADWSSSPNDVVHAVLARSPSRYSALHGDEHWRAVAHAGLVVGAATSGADLRLVFLFSLLHDAVRWNDHDDPEHGARAAGLLRDLVEEELLVLPDGPVELLSEACRLHSDGHTSNEPTIGACWDADRLNLWRLGWTPAPSLLSTAEARTPERIFWAREALLAVPSWKHLLASRW
jgi:uncharacterized protein